ncbi:MAG: TIGR02147 family protein [Oligoflexia bacterium]|nr:TIGR02147 family protein [Oligoflexia bacterium]
MDLFEYTDYRKYLKDYYQAQKARNPSYSFRVFANRARLASPNYLKLVIDGARRITDRNLEQFIRGLGLTKAEAGYFRKLVQYQESADLEAKNAHLGELLKSKQRRLLRVREVTKDRYEILRKWHHWVIREMVLLRDFKAEPGWIAGRLGNRVTPKEAQESLELLERLEFVIRGADGRYRQSEPLISTSDEISSLLIRDLHKQFVELGVESLFRDAIEEREMNGLTLAVSRARVPELKQAIKNFRKELNRAFTAEEVEGDVYHLVINLFPVTRTARFKGDLSRAPRGGK